MTEFFKMNIRGHIMVYYVDDPSKILYEDENVITLTIKPLFARLLANSAEPAFGIWGLALGTGDPSWGSNTQPTETALQTAMETQLIRKPLSSASFVDSNNNPITGFSNMVDFQTIVNATTDNIEAVQIREMGLIGGGTSTTPSGGPTNMLTAPYWDPTTQLANSVVLCNYKTLPALILPPNVNIGFSWILSF